MNKLIINKEDMRFNLDKLRGMTNARIIAVVKGNGYGLGAAEYAQVLRGFGVDFFAVSEIHEARQLRESGIDCDILLLQSNELLVNEIAELELIATVGSMGMLSALRNACAERQERMRLHLKIDSGFGRYGFHAQQMDELCNYIKQHNIEVEGIYSHLYNSFSKNKQCHAQFDYFNKAVDSIKSHGVNVGMRHIVSSHGFMLYPQMHLDAVRLGSALLGRLLIPNGLKKVGYAQSVVSHIATLPKKHNIGYGDVYRTKSNARIAVIPIGYTDGVFIEKSRDTFRLIDILRYIYNDIKQWRAKRYVRINNAPCQIVGRICMCNIFAHIGNSVNVGDIVTLDCNPLFISNNVIREFV